MPAACTTSQQSTVGEQQRTQQRADSAANCSGQSLEASAQCDIDGENGACEKSGEGEGGKGGEGEGAGAAVVARVQWPAVQHGDTFTRYAHLNADNAGSMAHEAG